MAPTYAVSLPSRARRLHIARPPYSRSAPRRLGADPCPVPVGDLELVGVDYVAVVVAGLDGGVYLAAVVASCQVLAAGDVSLPFQERDAADVRRLSMWAKCWDAYKEQTRIVLHGVGLKTSLWCP
jgi:hypothetical protein